MIDVEEALRVKDNFAKYKDVKSILIRDTTDGRMPKVSICIPTYNRVETLRETVDSCLNQVDFDDYNIIISDNNPERNDATEQYVSTIQSDKILYYKHEKNIGMYGNLNRIYELSKAEYTACIHDDDMLFPHFLSICYRVMANNKDIDLLYPNKVEWVSNINIKPQEAINNLNFIYKNTIIDFIIGNPHPPTGMMSRTKSIKETGGFDSETYPSNDYYFLVKATQNLSVYTMHQKLYVYRIGVNASLKLQTVLGFIKVDLPLKKYMLKNYSFFNFFSRQINIIYSRNRIKDIKVADNLYDIKSCKLLTIEKNKLDFLFASLLNSILKYIVLLNHAKYLKFV